MEAKDLSLPTKLDWQEKEKKIIFSVVSNGTSSTDWNKRLKNVGHDTRKILEFHSFRETKGIKTDIVILKGENFPDNYSLEDVLIAAGKHSLKRTEAETACLTAEKITAEDMKAMGLQWIVFFHKPIMDNNAMLEYCLLEIVNNCHNCRLESLSDRPGFSKYNHSYGFAFAAN
jgi:hypothetical protein